MNSQRRRYLIAVVCVLLLTYFPLACDAFRRHKSESPENAAAEASTKNNFADEDIPPVHYLVELIGKELYEAVNKPKYKFYIYMTIGTLPNERNTIVLISTICNVLYGLSILLGFMFFNRGTMLIFTIATMWIGPAMVLILLGTCLLALGAFAVYPVTSVFAMTTWFFFTSQLAQTLGRRYGLDSDEDGDVDWLDLLYFLSKTKIGGAIGLATVYDVLNQCHVDPFREIHRRLDQIQRSTEQNAERLLQREEEGSPTRRNGHQKNL